MAAYQVLQELHNRGVLEIMRGALAASDEILETVEHRIKKLRIRKSHFKLS